MSFLICNFLGDSLPKKRDSGFSRVAIKTNSNVCSAELYKCGDELRFVQEGTTCEGELVDFLGNLSCEKLGCTAEELKHEEGNEIILIATEGIRLYSNIPTYLKYLTTNKGVIVALIKGVISVVSDDGEEISLSRNTVVTSVDEGVFYSYKDIARWNRLVDKESDVCYSEYVVNDCIATRNKAKDGTTSLSIKFNKENFVVLNSEVFIQGANKKKLLEQKRKEEALKQAEMSRILAEQRAREEEARLEKKKGKKSSTKGKVKGAKKSDDVVYQTGSLAAAAFLDFVNNANSKK